MREKLEDLIFTYSKYMKQKFGGKVFRVGLSTGIKCPHRVHYGGCIFCNPETFTGTYQTAGLSVKEQLEKAVPRIKETTGANRLLAYFQDETSTAGDINYLKQVYQEALDHEAIIGLIVSTRPDFLSQEVMDLLKSFDVPLTLEIGLQTINEKSLRFINRGHDLQVVEKALELAQNNQIDLGVHIVIGIPGETITQMQETIQFISSHSSIKEVKFHNLVVYKNTRLAELYRKEKFELIDIDQYIEILCNLLPCLRGDIVVSRLFTSNLRRTQIALGDYPGSKPEWLNQLRLSLLAQGLYQGCKTKFPYNAPLHK